MSDDPSRRRRRMVRIGELLPEAARQLGLEEELRLSRAGTTFEAIVAELVPPAHGSCRVVSVDGATLVVAADAPIVGQELRLHEGALVAAFRAAPGGAAVTGLRVVVRVR